MKHAKECDRCVSMCMCLFCVSRVKGMKGEREWEKKRVLLTALPRFLAKAQHNLSWIQNLEKIVRTPADSHLHTLATERQRDRQKGRDQTDRDKHRETDTERQRGRQERKSARKRDMDHDTYATLSLSLFLDCHLHSSWYLLVLLPDLLVRIRSVYMW